MFRISIDRSVFWRLAIFSLALAGLVFISSSRGYTVPLSEKPGSLEAGFNEMYNLDFSAAHTTFQNWEELHREDPLGAASNAAAYLFGEFDRLHILEFDLFTDSRRTNNLGNLSPDHNIQLAFEGELARANEIATKILAQSSDDPNALFAKMLIDGLRADYAGLLEKRKLNALEFLKSSRAMAEKLIAIDPDYADAYLAIGIENYVLGMRSAPARWILRRTGAQTSKEKGIENLKITAEKGKYLAPYARVLLTIAYLRDDNRNAAKRLLVDLVRDFPKNHRYQAELAHLQS